MRILKHSMTCSFPAGIDGASLVTQAIAELAKKDSTLLPRLNKKLGIIPSKRPGPPLKRVKTAPTTASVLTAPVQGSSQKHADPSGSQQVAKYRTEGRKVLDQKANDALVEFIVCCGVAPWIVGSDEFKHFVNTLNGNYSLISRTTFEDSLVPAYAATVRIAILDYLKTCWFLSLGADSGKLKKKFVSVTVTTVHRQSFCVDLDDVSRVSQTGEYFAELFKKVLSMYSLTHGH
jgi:hypothetical protein